MLGTAIHGVHSMNPHDFDDPLTLQSPAGHIFHFSSYTYLMDWHIFFFFPQKINPNHLGDFQSSVLAPPGSCDLAVDW